MQHEKTGQLDLRERRTVILDSVILRLIRIEDAISRLVKCPIMVGYFLRHDSGLASLMQLSPLRLFL